MMKLRCSPIVLLSFLVSGLVAQPAAYAQQEPLDAQDIALQCRLERLNENIRDWQDYIDEELTSRQ